MTRAGGRECKVAGHDMAAGVYLHPGFKSKLKGLFDWNLNAETEAFIDEIRARL